MSEQTSVPFASRGHRARERAQGRLESLIARFGDQMVRFAEDALGEELDAKVARIRLHPNEAGFDPFGFDPDTARYALALSAFLHRFYFRTEVFGVDRMPEGRVLVVANHSGQIPVDGLLIGTSLMLDAEPPRFPRSMVERWSAELPFVSVLFPRLGQVVGSPDNARRLLQNEEALVVFPEGSRGISKTFDRRYQLVPFGLGFMRLALETGTPIVPVGVVGGEEQLVSVANVEPLAKLLGMPAFPIIPQLFVGMAFPLPTRYRLYFGEPMVFEGDPDDEDAIVGQKVSRVQEAIQRAVDRGLKERRAVFW
ncbi:MAG TPA: lysophospholipid acyltransferase family protein [Sandaracinaceae bacterium LLY-WYZ-13_1]|nr:lysophospholipid acyltransferase family protein [Sandaracinaceae bacterium LLY-WYZ-13_1]